MTLPYFREFKKGTDKETSNFFVNQKARGNLPRQPASTSRRRGERGEQGGQLSGRKSGLPLRDEVRTCLPK